MDKRLDCRDMGWQCDVSVCAGSTEDAIGRLGSHIQSAHAMQGFSKEFYDRALSSIREGSCEITGSSAQESLCGACFGTCLC